MREVFLFGMISEALQMYKSFLVLQQSFRVVLDFFLQGLLALCSKFSLNILYQIARVIVILKFPLLWVVVIDACVLYLFLIDIIVIILLILLIITPVRLVVVLFLLFIIVIILYILCRQNLLYRHLFCLGICADCRKLLEHCFGLVAWDRIL